MKTQTRNERTSYPVVLPPLTELQKKLRAAHDMLLSVSVVVAEINNLSPSPAAQQMADGLMALIDGAIQLDTEILNSTK